MRPTERESTGPASSAADEDAREASTDDVGEDIAERWPLLLGVA